MSIFSNEKLLSYQLHDVENNIQTGEIWGKDYIGMSKDSCISYDIGILKPGEEKDFTLFIFMKKNEEGESDKVIQSKFAEIKKIEVNKKISETSKYWKNYVQAHINLKLDELTNDVIKVYKRSILLFPLLTNSKTGGIIAAPEIDEERKKCGGYSYCWPRDSVFITKALDMLKMQDVSNNFYLKFCKNTQSSNGMWEQRFFSNGNLAPCWGYQIDETASVIYGVYEHFKITKDIEFLKQSIKMCETACDFLFKYIENLLQIEEKDVVKKEIQNKFSQSEKTEKRLSYDIWEMNEGVHLYSLASIYAGFDAMISMESELQKIGNNNRVKQEIILNRKTKLEKYKEQIKEFILEHFCDKNKKILYRNLEDKKMDISILGTVFPFNVFMPTEKIVVNTIDMINITLRTYTGGYLRFEDDNYIGGKNPWIISTLWMAIYYIKIGKKKEAIKLLNFTTNTANSKGFLAEQVDNDSLKPAWVIGLGWSHAMFVIVLNTLNE